MKKENKTTINPYKNKEENKIFEALKVPEVNNLLVEFFQILKKKNIAFNKKNVKFTKNDIKHNKKRRRLEKEKMEIEKFNSMLNNFSKKKSD